MAVDNTTANHHEFKAEVKQLLNILVHSLYTNRDIFLRELISNASDALDKLRFESISGSEIWDSDLPLEINVSFDKDKHTINVADTGIGMTKDEIISNIGTIARSGSAEFLKKVADSNKDVSNIIGKFGVGFYSIFMVASEVILKTKSFKKDEPAMQWKSDGLGSYELEQLTEEVKRGTSIEIHLREDAFEFAERYRLESIIKQHSNFITFPIYLEKERINTLTAIWREPKTSVIKEQYNEFYKYLSYDSEEPLDIIHISVDAPIQFNSLLYIPKKNMDLFGFSRHEYGLDLYVRRVLIQHENKEVLPEYLGFVKGVVDSEDLPLNISRETLQENAIFNKISSSITGQVLSHLSKMSKDDPEKFKQFWKEHGKIFRLGYSDYSNREKFAELLRFNSSVSKDSDELIQLSDYVSRMKPEQKEIYYVSGASREAIEADPHLEIFKNKGIEVLYLYDPIDEFVMDSLFKYKDYNLKSVEHADPKELEKFGNKENLETVHEALSEEDEKKFEDLLKYIKEILGDRVTEVRVSERLSESPSCLANPANGMTSQMEKIMHMVNKDTSVPKKIFEVNKDHKLIRNLLKIYISEPKDEYIRQVVEQLYESALLLEGYLNDPHRLVNRIKDILEKSSEWHLAMKSIK
ncbi:MAG: molecular chaperone HtpG [Ignavibacteria bacterium]|jgi:molecular chaperone HtpG|nr:molecular chaperone HtpG [Ignavibacteria bacterium]MCU7504077.1 molecular chaperone HtpG [Ignavibacteria bacterium]MCU7518254.1 molecular chaperone HtpG [Ignavibacteria bacterium]